MRKVMEKNLRRTAAAVLALALAAGLSACGGSKEEAPKKIESADDLEGAKIGVQTGTTGDIYCTDDYGDENIAFINTVPDEGRKIVNCIYVLWELDVIASPGAYMTFAHMAEHSGYFIEILKHPMPIARLISSLNEYRNNKDTYAEPDKYLEILLSSVATEINNEIHDEAELKKLTKKEK